MLGWIKRSRDKERTRQDLSPGRVCVYGCVCVCVYVSFPANVTVQKSYVNLMQIMEEKL